MPTPSIATPEKQSFIVSRFLLMKGQFSVAEWLRPCEVKKSCPSPIFKHSRLSMRGGISYDSMKAVKEGRDNGSLPAVNAGLPYGQWLKYPYLIECNGDVLLRLYPNGNGTIEETYYMDGQPVTLDAIRPHLYASETRYEEAQPLVKNVKLKNMIDLK